MKNSRGRELVKLELDAVPQAARIVKNIALINRLDSVTYVLIIIVSSANTTIRDLCFLRNEDDYQAAARCETMLSDMLI